MTIIVTQYAQRNKDTKLCKRYEIKRNKLVCLDCSPVPESTMLELTKGMDIRPINVEKLSDLTL